MMWRYKQPGFALRLLCELQKQQQCSVHCDTLLQTEGVSIPAHSCVLSALSPVFCRAFANAPSLPVGQSRLVQLEAVGAYALLKLVGFMYSGEIEGESLDEQQEVIDIAYKLGFSNFMVGKQKQVNRHQNKTASWREIGLQTEETGGRKKDACIQILSEKQSFSHSGTQTDSTEAHFADTCIASEPELSIVLPEELTDVPSEYNSISPDAGLAWIDENVAHSPSNSAEALVRVHAKPKQTQKEKKRAKISKKQGGTQISLKIKLKRQRSGALWEIVSVEEESSVDGSKPCGSSDDPPVTHSLAERVLPSHMFSTFFSLTFPVSPGLCGDAALKQTHKSSVEVQLSPTPSLNCQNLETVTLTPPSELNMPLLATPTRPPSEYFRLHIPDPVPLSSPLQMPPLSPGLSQSEESDEHIAKLLEMVTVGLNSLPSVTVEGDNSMHAHLDHKLETCAAVANSPASYLCLLGHNLGAMGSGTTSSTSEQREAGSEDLSSCRKWDLKNVASVASNPTLLSYTSPCMTQKKNIDSSFTPSCPVTDIVPSRLTFGTEGHENQNVVELKTVSNNFFWGADTYAQSGKQTVSDASEECDIQTQISRTATSNAAQADPTPVGKQCPEQLHVTDQVSAWQSSDVGQAPNSESWADFSEMRLPRCLSPLTLEAGETTGIFSAQDPLRPLEFSSCLSASHVNHQPALRYTSSPIQPQALPGKTNQQNPSCTSLHVNELQCSAVGKNSCPLRSNRDHNGEASECKSEEKKAKITDFENDLLKGTKDNILDRQMNESVIREISTARHSVEAVNEPYRKKAKMAGYPNGVDTQTVKVVNPCSVKIKNIRHIDNIQDISNPVPSEKMNCLKAAKARKTVSVDLKSQENVSLCQRSQSFKCKGQEACQKGVWDAKQPGSFVAKRGCGRPLQKRTCAKTLMEDLSEISKLNSSPAVLNALSSSSHHDLQLTQMSKECVPIHESERLLKVDHPLGLAQTITKEKDLINECEKNNIPEPEMENPFLEPEKVIPDVNLNREEDKQPKISASLSKKASFCDKIFHQSVFSAGTTVTQHFLPINHQLRSVLQTTDRKIRTSLPLSLTCKKLREPPKPDRTSTKLMKDNNKQEKKDTAEECEVERGVPGTHKPHEVLDKCEVDSENRDDGEQVENSSINVNGCLVNGNIVREADISANAGISIHDSVDLNAASRLCTIPPARDFNNNFGMDNNLQHESTTTLFHPENMTEKPKTDEQITESLCEVPVSNEPAEVKLIKTKELHLEGTGSTQIGNMEGQEVWKKEKENEKTVRETECVEISRMNEYEAGTSDAEVDVIDESAQLATGHGDEVVATGGSVDDIDVEESQMSLEMVNDGEALAHEEELNGQQILRTQVEVMPPDEATSEMTSEVINPEASSIRHGEEPDLSSASIDTLGSSALFLPDVSSESAEDSSSAEEELVVDDISDSPLEPCTVAGTQCNTILEEEDELNKEEGEEEEEEVDVTGEESN